MREIYKFMKNLNIFTEEGIERIQEAHKVVDKIDEGLTKDELTILNNFADEFPIEYQELMREKESEMHGIRLR